ncbi:PREDICTED: transient receptor potential cation channel trpm-like [Rhagoletis zephyria]|uniref:transient receptor potential cation channel trpm-like n=1 Tax=Rhagoletis zephyria TaxID=28612 RepID=UPI00081185BD|nr:PREDICTED: transient receptor potential cation channel trpm-like [Rhagoletis zephyria]
MFQRFTVVMEYQQKPVLPPPFIALCHFYSLLKYCIRKAKGLEVQRDNGLKLFLEKDDMERLYDFEEECVEGFFHEQEIILNQSTDERVKNTTERVEILAQKIEDINQKENVQTATVQSIEFRLRKMEESSEQILSHLAVIHRFMSMHMLDGGDLHASNMNLGGDLQRVRTVSMSDNETLMPTPNLQVNNRRRFNRSLTEVRPDAYIFDEGTHFEVVPVPEEPDDLPLSEHVSRKISMQSESDSDIYLPMSQRPSTCETVKRTPYVTVRQDTGASTESKDTLTPLGADDEHTLVGENSDETGQDLNFEAAKRRALRQRTVSLCRRNSEACSIIAADINRSRISLNQLPLSRRQMSLTQSEPDSDKEAIGGGKSVLHAKSGRNVLLKLHTEYTSITDELESVCHLIASPTVSLPSNKASLDRPMGEMSKAEFAAMLEKQHLKECEENDYMMLEGLFQARASIDDTDNSFGTGASAEFSHRHPLRRETAIELSPSKPPSGGGLLGCGNSSDTSGAGSGGPGGGGGAVVFSSSSTGPAGFLLKNERPWQRNSSMEQQQTYQSAAVPTRATSEFLNAPFESTGRLFKKSSESLQKGSSTETDYSAHPYRFIKQSSNDTTTSMTGSYNIDTPSLAAELSLDAVETNTQTTPTTVQELVASSGAGGNGTATAASNGNASDTTARYQPLRTAAMGANDGKRDMVNKRSSEVATSTPMELGATTAAAAAAVMSQVQSALPRAMQLKKQFSMDQASKVQPQQLQHSLHTQTLNALPATTATTTGAAKTIGSALVDTSATSAAAAVLPALAVPAKLLSSLKPPGGIKTLGMNILKESSSSTEESKESGGDNVHATAAMPQISTHTVQDEIAKLSSNIKSSTESEKDPPYNETMC